MSRGVNKTISIGNLCADPEQRLMPSGGAVTNVRIAMNDSYKDKNTGQVVEKVEYMSVVFFNRLAEIVGEYLKKGSKVYIEGSLRTRKWQDKEGRDQYTTEIVASEMQMLDGRGGQQGADGGHQKPQGGHRQGQAPAQHSQGGGFDDFDSDIPF